MRTSAIIVLLLIFRATIPAQTRATVDQMERLLDGLSRQNDDSAAAQISPYELSERVPPARLARWRSAYAGTHMRSALLALSDAAALQPPSASDVSSLPPPDEATQTAMLERATTYISGLRPHLPDFTAATTTTRFQIASREEIAADERSLQFQQMSRAKLRYHALGPSGQKGRNLYLLGSTTSSITYRDGAEVRSPLPAGRQDGPLVPGSFTSFGEFGPILIVVNTDAAHGGIEWDHWENSPDGPVAVFRYHVPKDQSHFATYSVLSEYPGIAPRPHYPAYHGEITLNPADGSILRILVLTDVDPKDPSSTSGVVVEYGPVVIGGRTYTCPVHAVAVSTQGVLSDSRARSNQAELRKYINDVSFTDYHVFRSELRVVPEAPPAP